LIRLAFFVIFTFTFAAAEVVTANIAPSFNDNIFMGIKILDEKELIFKHIQGVKFSELSDVTYDAKTNTLYAVGDKGMLYAFRAQFSEKIDVLKPLRATKLKASKNKRLRKWKRDSEGLALDGNRHLLISFEGESPKIGWFHKNSSSFGNIIRKHKLPKILKNSKNYRSLNKSLESLAWHKKYGILTATEWPLSKNHKKNQTIYALTGKKWHFKAEKEDRSGVVAIEVMDDGNILVLERSYTGMLAPLVITLKKVFINNCKAKMCKTEVLAKMNSRKGWNLDNFEGLARVGENRYVMVSDNGNNFFQKTLLFYFEVL
jgi:hypothetical protein